MLAYLVTVYKGLCGDFAAAAKYLEESLRTLYTGNHKSKGRSL